MRFGIMAFNAGIFIQFGGVDIIRCIRVRCLIGYTWHGIYRTKWTWLAKAPEMALYDKA